MSELRAKARGELCRVRGTKRYEVQTEEKHVSLLKEVGRVFRPNIRVNHDGLIAKSCALV